MWRHRLAPQFLYLFMQNKRASYSKLNYVKFLNDSFQNDDKESFKELLPIESEQDLIQKCKSKKKY